jgi:CheY-like chemotaxis protein
VKIQVEATTNGEEAIAAWEKRGPGYFQAAMFDHRTLSGSPTVHPKFNSTSPDMPICDGVEAVRRIRVFEAERGYEIILPSKRVVVTFS